MESMASRQYKVVHSSCGLLYSLLLSSGTDKLVRVDCPGGLRGQSHTLSTCRGLLEDLGLF